MAEYSCNESHNGSQIEVPLGTVVKITLPENATTGFEWRALSIDGDGLEVQGSDYLSTEGADAGVGAGSSRVFTLSTTKAGEFQVSTERDQNWDAGKPDSRFHVTIKVS